MKIILNFLYSNLTIFLINLIGHVAEQFFIGEKYDIFCTCIRCNKNTILYSKTLKLLKKYTNML